jgi:hypothetical protein
MPSGFTEGILHGIFCKSGQLMLTHVQLQTGAHWSGLPLSALYHKKINDKLSSISQKKTTNDFEINQALKILNVFKLGSKL